jgi:ATPase subunit of ABC transporter with duplicated ATPase domains
MRRALFSSSSSQIPCILIQPTNHLDASALEWLKNKYTGAVLLISHDRTFLNQAANGIFELSPVKRNVKFYAGNYDAYFIEKEKRTAAIRSFPEAKGRNLLALVENPIEIQYPRT